MGLVVIGTQHSAEVITGAGVDLLEKNGFFWLAIVIPVLQYGHPGSVGQAKSCHIKGIG